MNSAQFFILFWWIFLSDQQLGSSTVTYESLLREQFLPTIVNYCVVFLNFQAMGHQELFDEIGSQSSFKRPVGFELAVFQL